MCPEIHSYNPALNSATYHTLKKPISNKFRVNFHFACPLTLMHINVINESIYKIISMIEYG